MDSDSNPFLFMCNEMGFPIFSGIGSYAGIGVGQDSIFSFIA